MKISLPASFRFSWLITLAALLVASGMLFASRWQWQRYEYKKDLVSTYSQHSTAEPLPFPLGASKPSDYLPVLHRKVNLKGRYDFDNQAVLINRKHASGPGFLLLTPFLPEGSDRWIVVSRGFIPFEDSEPEDWRKYDFDPEETLSAVVQKNVKEKSFITPLRPPDGTHNGRQVKWAYANIAAIADSMPDQTIPHVYLERLGESPRGKFPAEAVSIRVPPSTHFGYAIEWTLLACGTLLVAFLVQAFPRRMKKPGTLLDSSDQAEKERFEKRWEAYSSEDSPPNSRLH